MKILINSESLRPPLTGIGNYTLHLLQALQQQPEVTQIDYFNGRQIHWLSTLLQQHAGGHLKRSRASMATTTTRIHPYFTFCLPASLSLA